MFLTNPPPVKIIVWGWIGLAILVVLACTGISAFVGWNLTHPQRKPVTASPAQLNLAYRDITFPSRTDKLNLSGWYIPVKKATSLVILAHGYGQNRSSEEPTLPVVRALNQAGISTLIFDFRGSGSSAGLLVSVGDYEQRDLLGAIDFAKSLGYKKIGLLGFSMGASTAALVAVNAPSEVKAVVLDSAFADLRTYLESNLHKWSGLPNWPFTPLILRELPLMTGINLDRVSPLKAVPALKQKPILLITGDADDTISQSNSLLLFQLLANPHAALWTVKGAGHIGAYHVAGTTYLSKVVSFFRQTLQP